ncbi:MAG: hypothetical protein QMD94_05315 [Candidatus Omnitrophota bacterium]|nr:hypothetical protein [Candidatus Omnitrophota bacterium]
MRLNAGLVAGIVMVMFLLSTGITFGHETTQGTTANADTQWAWGEVVSVDSVNKTIIVKTFDYETEQEQELSVIIDNKTAFENVKSLNEIKALDVISIDYTIDMNGKMAAKTITIEAPMSEEEKEAVGEGTAPTFIPEVPSEAVVEEDTSSVVPGKQ